MTLLYIAASCGYRQADKRRDNNLRITQQPNPVTQGMCKLTHDTTSRHLLTAECKNGLQIPINSAAADSDTVETYSPSPSVLPVSPPFPALAMTVHPHGGKPSHPVDLGGLKTGYPSQAAGRPGKKRKVARGGLPLRVAFVASYVMKTARIHLNPRRTAMEGGQGRN